MSTVSRQWSWWIGLGLVIVLLGSCAAPAATPAPTSPPAASATTSAAPSVATTQAVAPATTVAAPATSAAPATTAAQVAPIGDLKIGVDYMGTETVDPILMSMSGSFHAPLIYDYIVGIAPNGKLSKDTGIATDWNVSADGLTWTFNLRKGVKFQNGDDLTSEDTKFTLERAVGQKSRSGYRTTTSAIIDTITTPDPYTMVIKTKAPYAILPYYLSLAMGNTAEGAIVPKKYVQQKGDDDFAVHPIGSGPYRVVDLKPGSSLKLEAISGAHWRIGVPKYKTITFSVIAEPSTLIASYKTGQNDIIAVPMSMYKEVSGSPISVKKDANPLGLMLAQQWDPVPFKDVRVRQAMAEAIDRKAINDALSSGMSTSNWLGSIVGKSALGYPNLAEIPYNPDHAKQLLKDAGYAQGAEVDLYNFPRVGGFDIFKMGEMIGEMWRAVGIKATIKRTDYATFRPMWYGVKAPNAIWINVGPNLPLNDALLETVYGSKGVGSQMKDPKFDATIDGMRSAKTLDDYGKAQGQALQILRDEYRQIGILTGGEFYATNQALKGWDPGTMPGFLDFDAIIRTKK